MLIRVNLISNCQNWFPISITSQPFANDEASRKEIALDFAWNDFGYKEFRWTMGHETAKMRFFNHLCYSNFTLSITRGIYHAKLSITCAAKTNISNFRIN